MAQEAAPRTSERLIAESTNGVIFLGTPHEGSRVASVGAFVSLLFYWRNSRARLLQALSPESDELHELHSAFVNSLGSFQMFIFNFFETQPMLWGQVVSKKSAVMPEHPHGSLDVNHTELNKFASSEDPNYLKVRLEIENALSFDAKWQEFLLEPDLSGAPLINTFVGRNEELQKLEHCLFPGARTRDQRIVIIHGLGGMGKTQLALNYALRHRECYSGILWLNGRTERMLRRDFAAVAKKIPIRKVLDKRGDVPSDEDGITKAIKAVQDWLNTPNNSQWLLIFDNVEDVPSPRSQSSLSEGAQAAADLGSYDIRPYYEPMYQGTIVVTTRRRVLSELSRFNIELHEVPVEDGISILCNASKRSRHEEGVKALVGRLANLPLALHNAGCYISRKVLSTRDCLDIYEERSKVILAEKPLLSRYECSVMTTWTESIEAAQVECAPVRKFLGVLSFLENSDIWYGVFALGYDRRCAWIPNAKEEQFPSWLTSMSKDKATFDDIIEILGAYSFISRNIDSDGYYIHPLVQEWVRSELSSVEHSLYQTAAICLIGTAQPGLELPTYCSIQQRLLPHAYCSLKRFPGPEELSEVALLGLHGIGYVFFERGRYAEGMELVERALASGRAALGSEHRLLLSLSSLLARFYRREGRLPEAYDLASQTLEVQDKAWGSNEGSLLDILETTTILGLICYNQGKQSEAERQLLRAVNGRESLLGEEHPLTLQAYNNLGIVYEYQGDLAQAEKTYLRALSGGKKSLGIDHVAYLDYLSNLANVYGKQKRFVDAERALLKVATEGPRRVGEGHPSTLGALNNLGCLYQDMEDLGEAERTLHKALLGYRDNFGPDSLNVHMANTLFNLGDVYFGQGKLIEARDTLEAALEKRQKTLGSDHEKTKRTAQKLKTVLQRLAEKPDLEKEKRCAV